MRVRSLLVLAVVLVAVSCKTSDSPVDLAVRDLASCDYSDKCASAFKAIGALDAATAQSIEGLSARLLRAKIGVHAIMAFPEPRAEFLAKAGTTAEDTFKALRPELDALSAVNELTRDVNVLQVALDVYRNPICQKMESLEATRQGGQEMSDTAALARIRMMGELLASVEPTRIGVFADAARHMIACTMAERSDSSSVLVEARNRWYDLVDHCPTAKSTDLVLAESCAEARKLVETNTLPLPFPDAASGDLAGAVLPVGRGLGLRFSPPWIISLAAGRVQVLDQGVLPPGVRKSDPVEPVTLVDLRLNHRIENVRNAVEGALKTRKPIKAGHFDVIPLVIDRSATFADIAELLDSILAINYGMPVLATLPSGARAPSFLPINYRISGRPMSDPIGRRQPFEKNQALELSLDPFSLQVGVAGAVEPPQKVAIERESGENAASRPDLRSAYKMVAGLVGPSGRRSAWLEVAPTVTMDLLVVFLESISVRFSNADLETVTKFASATSARGTNGERDYMLPVMVMRSEGRERE